MSDEFVAGIVVGMLTGGLIGILAVALATAGSDRGSRSPKESSMRVDLLPDLHEADRSPKRSVAETKDFEREMRELVRRYGLP
jgi:hypothetical protein